MWLQALSRFLATASLSRNLCIAVGSITPHCDTLFSSGAKGLSCQSLPVFPSHLCFSEPTCRPLILCCGFTSSPACHYHLESDAGAPDLARKEQSMEGWGQLGWSRESRCS